MEEETVETKTEKIKELLRSRAPQSVDVTLSYDREGDELLSPPRFFSVRVTPDLARVFARTGAQPANEKRSMQFSEQYPNIVKRRSFCRLLPAPSVSKVHERYC